MEQFQSFQRFKAVRMFLSLYKIRIVRLLIPFLFIIFIYWEGKNKLKQINLGSTLHQLRNVSFLPIFLILISALAAVAFMTGYDLIIRRHFRMKVSFSKLFQYAWISNSFNNFLGFAGFTGASTRTVLYKKQQIPIKTIIIANAFLAPALITGLSILAWLAIFGLFPAHQLFQTREWLILEVWGMALYLPFFLLISRSNWFSRWMNKDREPIPWRIVTASLVVSLGEWLFAGLVFWIVGTQLSIGLPVDVALGIYIASAVAGLISLAPGGLGSFDLTALIGMEAMGVSSPKAAAVLVLFRLFYFIIPWLMGLALAVKEFVPSREQVNDVTVSLWHESLNRWQKFWSWPGQFRFLSDLGVAALAMLVFLCGLLLLLSAATPGILYRLKFTAQLLTLPVMTLSHQLSLIIGIILMVLARGIRYRVRRAYQLTVFMLSAGAIFTFAKAFDFEEALFLLFVMLLLWISRERFYRETAPFSRLTVFVLGFLTLVSVIAYLAVGLNTHPVVTRYIPEKVQRLFFQPDEIFITGVIGLVGAWAFLITWVVLRPKRKIEAELEKADMEKVEHFLKQGNGSETAHLIFLADKNLYWALDGEVLLAYVRVRDKLVVLGDPLGRSVKVRKAIEEFQNFADRYALTTVFYQVSPSYLNVYHETGYRFFKLGEEALVDLNSFSLTGKSKTAFRTARNRLEREGFQFEVSEPPFSASFLQALKTVSDSWLGDRKEKRFSLGRFNEDYLQRAPLAVIKTPEGQVIAFASLMPSYNEEHIVSIDLMRHLDNIPNGTMDVLFTRLFEWAKEQGYEQFNLGMAPLSNVGETPNAMRQEKMAHLVFQYGNYWYGFEGLRRYKEKYSPDWEPRYLAFPPSVSLPLLMMDLVKLVSRSK